jgi:hypothetical protein
VTTQEEIQLGPALVAVATFVGREINAGRIERKRSQRVVVAEEAKAPKSSQERGGWAAAVRVRNDGIGSAFNMRFGVEYLGVPFPYRAKDDDAATGRRTNVIAPGAKLRKNFAWSIESDDFWAVAALRPDRRLHKSRAYWCRYENASGATWETRNPVEQSGKLAIRRVRFRRLGESRQRWRLRRARRALDGAGQASGFSG